MNNITLLKRALKANAAFSGLTGAVALASAGSLAETLGPPAWSLRGVGAGLLAFAALVALEARAPDRAGARRIMAADLGWVIGAAVVVAATPDWLTAPGRLTLGAVTAVVAVVAVVAVAQWRGLGVAS